MRIQLVPNTDNPRSCAGARALADDLVTDGHEPFATPSDAAPCGVSVGEGVASDADLVVALGGDGTILKAVHLLAGADVPILGINLGRLGFLCGASGDDPIGAVRAAVEGRAREERRVMLRARATHGGRVAGSHLALNEVFVGRSTAGRAVEIELSVDGEPVAQWLGDGVVAATPTGSTAYALSAGGPILTPDLRAIVVVPVNPHALDARPLVLGPSARLVLTFPEPARADACLMVDGDLMPCRSALSRVEIGLADEVVRTLHVDDRSFVSAARDAFFRS